MGPRWLKVEPPRLAMLGGLFFSTCAMVFYFTRQCFGVPMAPEDIVLGVAKTFLVSYIGTGFFVWYVLRVAERELANKETEAETVVEDEPSAEEEENNREDAGPPPEEPEESL